MPLPLPTADRLNEVASGRQIEFLSAGPFSHVVIDDLFERDALLDLVEAFPGADGVRWDLFHPAGNAGQKLVLSTESKIPALLRELIQFFHSALWIEFLWNLTGMAGLIVDPDLSGCGLHSTGPGGYVKIHSDSSRHPNRDLDQRLNLILYLNPWWREEWGGHLELWDRLASKCERMILPDLGRLVLFDTGTTCFHGHPYPLSCPPERRRNSVAIYYYVAARGIDRDHAGWRESPDFRPEVA